MNMCLHDVSTENFEIVSRDTLATEEDWMQERDFDVTVANPPYALEWDNGDHRYSDERFAGYNALAPKGNADLAFVQHIIYHMERMLTLTDLKNMSVNDLSSIDIAEHKELTDDMLKYMTSRFLGSLTDEEIESALVNMDTGIYDEQGNLIGDKCEEDDAYEWED